MRCWRRRQIDPWRRNPWTQTNGRKRRRNAAPGGSARVRHNRRCGSIRCRRQQPINKGCPQKKISLLAESASPTLTLKPEILNALGRMTALGRQLPSR